MKRQNGVLLRSLVLGYEDVLDVFWSLPVLSFLCNLEDHVILLSSWLEEGGPRSATCLD